jgi:lactate dehydrogenase-like 2-hydroxyacid dehydrogenase
VHIFAVTFSTLLATAEPDLDLDLTVRTPSPHPPMASPAPASATSPSGAGADPSLPILGLSRVFHPSIQPLVDSTFRVLLNPAFDYPDEEVRKEIRALFVHGHTKINAEVLARFPNLLVVANHGVGIDHIDVEACTAAGVVVGNTPDVLTGATADMALALLLAVARRVVKGDAISRDPSLKGFDPYWFGREVHHAVVGVIGMGRIGQAVARRCHKGFDMKVLYHNRRPVEKEIEEE